MIKSGEGITILARRLVVLLGAREPMLPWYDQGFYLSCYLINWRSGGMDSVYQSDTGVHILGIGDTHAHSYSWAFYQPCLGKVHRQTKTIYLDVIVQIPQNKAWLYEWECKWEKRKKGTGHMVLLLLISLAIFRPKKKKKNKQTNKRIYSRRILAAWLTMVSSWGKLMFSRPRA